jgi:ribose transport system ATP-binding protein
MSDGDVILHLQGLSKTFPGTVALDDVELDVRAGEIHGLMGQNGSGKSTLIKVLAGFHEPDDGATGQIRGRDFKPGDGAAAHHAGVRFVHQDLGLIDTLDCADNLAIGYGYATAAGGRISWRRQRAEARAALARFGRDDIVVTTPVSRLSAFERTALAIVRAVQHWESEVSLLVLDEPTAALPKPEVDKLFALIRRVAAAGLGVLLVSHRLDEVFTVADRVTVLRDGRVAGTREVAELDHAELITLMTGGIVEQVSRSQVPPDSKVLLSLTGVAGRVLHELDLEVRVGEIVGVAGLDGSGREELCGLVFGARRRRGSVAVNGTTVPPDRPDLSIAHGIALVPADRREDGLVMSDTLRENLTLANLAPFWRGGRLRIRQERREAREWIDRLGVRARSPESIVESLSGGNQQKVVLGKWLRTNPLVLLLDEPTQGVDVGAQVELHKLVRRAVDEGSGAIICSSDERELTTLCDRVLVLREGTVHAELAGDDLQPHRIIELSMRTAQVS